MSSNVSSVLKRTADTCESKELTDKQPFLKAVVDIAKTTPVSEGTVMGKTVKMCDIQNKVIGHHNTFVIDDTMISTNIVYSSPLITAIITIAQVQFSVE
jgi:hypothetical protein